jgi:soluble lytic murein transglycosylase-like protein
MMTGVKTIRVCLLSLAAAGVILFPQTGARANEAYAGLVARHAAAHGVPPSLVHRVIMRESRYNPRAVSRGNYGIMQIRLGTARAMGYSGGAAGLLDADTNMSYAVKYLAGAYRAAGGNADRAMALYASG